MLKSIFVLAALCAQTNADEPDVDADNGWVDFESQEHGFSVRLPSEAKLVSSKGNFTVNAAGLLAGVNYAVDANPMPGLKSVDDKLVRAALLKARDEGVSKINGKLVTDVEIMMFGKPGRAFSFQGRLKSLPTFVSCRLCIVGNRLYVLRVTQVGPQRASLQDAMTFFGSFKVLGTDETQPPLNKLATSEPSKKQSRRV